MVKLNAIGLLEKNGKTKYWLYKQLGMSYQNFSKMINNETKSIRYEVNAHRMNCSYAKQMKQKAIKKDERRLSSILSSCQLLLKLNFFELISQGGVICNYDHTVICSCCLNRTAAIFDRFILV